jgi:hypothetical protein
VTVTASPSNAAAWLRAPASWALSRCQ